MNANAAKSFFTAFIDFSFSNFVTTKIIKVVYALFILAAIGVVLMGWYGAIRQFTSTYGSAGDGLVALVLAPLMGFVTLIAGRIYCELLIVAFRIVEYLGDIRDSLKKDD